MLYDLERSTVDAISDGNDTESGNACFSHLSEEQLKSVEAIAMDMRAAYVKSAKQSIPLAETKIVHDRFHIMKLASEAVDKVRRCEHRELQRHGDKRLTGTRYLWLSGQENLTESQNWKQERRGLTRKCFETCGTTMTSAQRSYFSTIGTTASSTQSWLPLRR